MRALKCTNLTTRFRGVCRPSTFAGTFFRSWNDNIDRGKDATATIETSALPPAGPEHAQ